MLIWNGVGCRLLTNFKHGVAGNKAIGPVNLIYCESLLTKKKIQPILLRLDKPLLALELFAYYIQKFSCKRFTAIEGMVWHSGAVVRNCPTDM